MSIIEDLKTAAEVLRKADNVELYEKLLDAQEKALEIMDENHRLRLENQQLKEKLNLKEKIVRKNNAYWVEKDGTLDGPYCPTCYGSTDKMIPLQPSASRETKAYCPNCKNYAHTDQN